jgi:hypothetical protein
LDTLHVYSPRLKVVFENFGGFHSIKCESGDQITFVSNIRFLKCILMPNIEDNAEFDFNYESETLTVDILNLPNHETFFHVLLVDNFNANFVVRADSLTEKLGLKIFVDVNQPLVNLSDQIVGLWTGSDSAGTERSDSIEKLDTSILSCFIDIQLNISIQRGIGLLQFNEQRLRSNVNINSKKEIPTLYLQLSSLSVCVKLIDKSHFMGETVVENFGFGVLLVKDQFEQLSFDLCSDQDALCYSSQIKMGFNLDTAFSIKSVAFETPKLEMSLYPLLKQSNDYAFLLAVTVQKMLAQIKRKDAKSIETIISSTSCHITLIIGVLNVSFFSENPPYHSLKIYLQNLSMSFLADNIVANLSKFSITAISDFNTADSIIHSVIFTHDVRLESEKEVEVITIPTMEVRMSLTVIYILINALLFPIKVMQLFRDGSSTNNGIQKPGRNFKIDIPSLLLVINLPEKVDLQFKLDVTEILASNTNLDLSANSFFGSAYVPSAGKFFSNFLEFDKFSLNLCRLSPKDSASIEIGSRYARVTVSAKYAFSNILENCILLNKGVKAMLRDYLGLNPRARFDLGKTLIETLSFPNIFFKFDELNLTMNQNEFEAFLLRNYRIGYEENLERLNIEKAFFNRISSNDYKPDDIDRYINNLQLFSR